MTVTAGEWQEWVCGVEGLPFGTERDRGAWVPPVHRGAQKRRHRGNLRGRQIEICTHAMLSGQLGGLGWTAAGAWGSLVCSCGETLKQLCFALLRPLFTNTIAWTGTFLQLWAKIWVPVLCLPVATLFYHSVSVAKARTTSRDRCAAESWKISRSQAKGANCLWYRLPLIIMVLIYPSIFYPTRRR